MNEMLRTVLNGVMHNIRRIISRQDKVDKTLEDLGSSVDKLDETKGLKTLRVKVTDSNYDGVYESSHTGDEIWEHILAGGDVEICDIQYRYSTPYVYHLISVDNIAPGKECTFSKEWNAIGQGSIGYEQISISGDGRVTKKNVQLMPYKANVGQVLQISKVDEDKHPVRVDAVDLPKAITIDPALSIEGQAADAKAVGDALVKKAVKPLTINADDAPTTGSNSASGIPIFTIDYTPADLKAYADAGGSVTIVRYNRHYAMYDATEETAKFRFIEATDMQVDWYHAVLDANGAVSITKTTHKSRMETTTGGAVGQIPIIKSLDSKGRPSTWEFVGITDILPVYNGEVGEA